MEIKEIVKMNSDQESDYDAMRKGNEMNIGKANNIALVPVGDEKVFICEIDGKKYHLGPESNEKMDWNAAKKWTEDMGGILMPREVAIMAYKKDEVRKQFQKDVWYWLGEEYSLGGAWYQNFVDGGQYNTYKPYPCFVRAVFVE